MTNIKKIMKIALLAFVICTLLFSVLSVQATASTTIPLISFSPLTPAIPTLMFFSQPPILLFTPPPSDSSPVVSFQDINLANAISDATGIDKSDLTVNVLKSIEGTLDLSDSNITQLGGIEYLTNVEYLILSKNGIYSRNELKKLAVLSSLQSLDISALSITSIPSEICGMSNLKYLDISANRLDTLPSSFTNLELLALKCNYCFFDVSASSDVLPLIIGATSSADYQYQLNKIDMYTTCQEAGTVVAHWAEVPDVVFPNGAVAKVKRFSICEPDLDGDQGPWLDSASSSSTSFTFTGLNPAKTYSFDISVDYYIENTQYNNKYIKFYEHELFKPMPQPTPTPAITNTPTPTPTLEATNTPIPTPTPTSTPAQSVIITVNPDQSNSDSASSNNYSSTSILTILIILIIVLIVLIVALAIVFYLRMNAQRQSDGAPPENDAPPRQ